MQGAHAEEPAAEEEVAAHIAEVDAELEQQVRAEIEEAVLQEEEEATSVAPSDDGLPLLLHCPTSPADSGAELGRCWQFACASSTKISMQYIIYIHMCLDHMYKYK